VERLKSALGPLSGVVASLAGFVNRGANLKRLHKYLPLFAGSFDDYYYGRTYASTAYFNSEFRELYSKEFAELVDKQYSVSPVKRHLHSGQADTILNRMLYVDTKTTLPDDLLLKADKMTMANSVELRVPLLDHKILEFAASLPEDLKVRRFTTKYIAKRSLRTRVPNEILQRKKAGFPVPYEAWLRTELKSWVRDVLFDSQTVSRGYFNRSSIEHLLAENSRSGKYSKEVLSLLVLELWHRSFLTRKDTKEIATAPAVAAALAD
jgi:asparagine synthase (glutamine-hydrolysing)